MTLAIPLHILFNEEHYSTALQAIEEKHNRKINYVTLTRGDKCAVLTVKFV